MSQLIALTNVLQNLKLPADITPQPIKLPSPPVLSGPLAQNGLLSRVRLFANGRVKSPESVVILDGSLYTGQSDGWLVRVDGSGVSHNVVRFNMPACGTSKQKEGDCGRPMGIRINSQKQLVVADAYGGIIEVNPKTGALKQLVNARTLQVKGKPIRYINDLTIDTNGVIYFTSSSSKWTLPRSDAIIFEAEYSGRILKYDPRVTDPAKRVTELVGNLAFPNGLQLASDGSFLLVGEGTRAKILKIWIDPRNAKYGTIEDFATNLPGIVDNIRLSPRGTLWVGLSQVRHSGLRHVLDQYGDQPHKRGVLALLVRNNVRFDKPKYGMALELSMDGQVVRTLQDPLGWKYRCISQVTEVQGVLFIASPDRNFVGYVALKSLPPESKDTDLLAYPDTVQFLLKVEKNMEKMTNDSLKQALLDTIELSVTTKRNTKLLNTKITQQEDTVKRLKAFLAASTTMVPATSTASIVTTTTPAVASATPAASTAAATDPTTAATTASGTTATSEPPTSTSGVESTTKVTG